jgi:hypothetical protein
MAKKEEPVNSHWRTWLQLSVRRLIAYCVWSGVTIAILAGAVYGLWSHVRPHVITGPHYRVDPEQIVLTPSPPSWIRGDLRTEVIRTATLDTEQAWSILDGDLAERLYKAFSLHPWVAKVDRVIKVNSSGVRIELTYRRPVCMVEVPGGLYAVDSEAYLLPSSDFSPDDVKPYPRLAGIHTLTEGPVGTQWQDVHVQGAARIATVLLDHWTSLGLLRIAPSPIDSRLVKGREEYDLFTKQGTCIRWGSAEDTRLSGEPTLAQRVQRLRDFAKRSGSLDATDGPRVLDVRQGPEVIVLAESVVQPAEESKVIVPVSRGPQRIVDR